MSMVKRRPTSRLARKESKKLVRQTVVMAGAAIGVIVIFIYVILPSFIKILNVILGDSSSVEITDDIPPQAPVISAPLEATSSARIKINGFSEPNSQVVFVLNGQKSDQFSVEDDGSFENELNLDQGENSLTLYAIDEAGNESNATKNYIIVFDNQPPLLEISSPNDGETIVGKNNQNLVVSGKTEPDAKVYIDEKVTFPNTEGNFSYTFRLEEGENLITVEAIDKGGNVARSELSINFDP